MQARIHLKCEFEKKNYRDHPNWSEDEIEIIPISYGDSLAG